MQCTNLDCRAEVPDHKRYCIVCGTDAGFPNVRACSGSEDVDALNKRVIQAEHQASLRGCKDIVLDYRKAVGNSCAVICRSLSAVYQLVSGDNSLYATFYQGVYSDARLPENNEWDKIRESVDSLLFPYYYKDIRFASLSIDGSGLVGYGDYCIVLHDFSIKDRATVLEENAVLFVKRHRIVAGDKLPVGYRAAWPTRADIAIAKLSSKLTNFTKRENYQSITMNSTKRDADFIEVHIYGPIHVKAIKSISGPEPKRKADKVMLASLKRKLRNLGATWEARP